MRLEGKNPIREVINSGKNINKLYVLEFFKNFASRKSEVGANGP